MVTYQIDTLQIYLDLSMETRQLWKSEFLSQLNENSQSLVPPNLLEPSSMSVHWTVLTRIPSTEAICPCVGLMMLGHDTGFSTFTGHLVFLFPKKYPCYTYGCQNVPIKKQTPMKHPDLFTQKQNPHETPGLIHSPAPVVGTQQHQSVKTMWLWKWLMSAWRLLIKRRRDDEVGRRMS